MLVQEIMTRDVECINPGNTLQEAAQRMRSLDVGPLPVCDHDDLVGMITDRDIVVRAVAQGGDPKKKKVRDAMTPAIASCLEDQSIEEAAEIMKTKQVRRLAVLNRNHQLVGMISLADLALGCDSSELAGETLERISLPAAPPEGEAVLATPY